MNTHHDNESSGMPGESLLKIDQVAKYLNVSERHVRNLMERQLISFIRLGGAVRFDFEEVQEAKRRMTVRARS